MRKKRGEERADVIILRNSREIWPWLGKGKMSDATIGQQSNDDGGYDDDDDDDNDDDDADNMGHNESEDD